MPGSEFGNSTEHLFPNKQMMGDMSLSLCSKIHGSYVTDIKYSLTSATTARDHSEVLFWAAAAWLTSYMTSMSSCKFPQFKVHIGLWFTCLNTWSPAVGAVLRNRGNVGNWGLTGGSGPLACEPLTPALLLSSDGAGMRCSITNPSHRGSVSHHPLPHIP